MEKTSQVAAGVAPVAKDAPLNQAVQQAWQVNVVSPSPKAMPSERLKARAELVKKALSCGGGTY
jgi:hypothetical protein